MSARPHIIDQLTGLPNRRYLVDRLHGLDPASKVAVCFIDIDGFSSVNTAHGRRAGDMLLEQTAKRIGRLTDMGDILARSGRDEFVVVHRDRHRSASVARFAERVRQALARPYEIGPNNIQITASIGICTDELIDSPEALLARAAVALRSAKRFESNGIEIYDRGRVLQTAVSA